MSEITSWVKKIWKNRITEFPTRRTLTKEDGSTEIVTVTRNEGTVSEEGDAFDADTMNNLEERIDAGFTELNGKLQLSTEHTILYSNYFAANVTNNITLNDDFKNYKTLFFVCNNGTAALYCPTIYPASYIKKLYESTKNTQNLGTYPSINTFIGSAQSSAFIPIADNKFKLTTYTSGTFFVIGLK